MHMKKRGKMKLLCHVEIVSLDFCVNIYSYAFRSGIEALCSELVSEWNPMVFCILSYILVLANTNSVCVSVYLFAS